MKLAEALAERSDCQKKIEKLKARLVNCVRVQEGEQPIENPETLLKELRATHERMNALVVRINRTNANTPFDKGMSLSDALAQRDHLAALRASLVRVVEAASIRADRMTRSEVKYVSVVSVRDLQVEADSAAEAHRKLDSRIQELNWTVELVS
jgi:alpha-D-ribose 1-methylphosphonate 5-triphosphate synthase subunit PhnI